MGVSTVLGPWDFLNLAGTFVSLHRSHDPDLWPCFHSWSNKPTSLFYLLPSANMAFLIPRHLSSSNQKPCPSTEEFLTPSAPLKTAVLAIYAARFPTVPRWLLSQEIAFGSGFAWIYVAFSPAELQSFGGWGLKFFVFPHSTTSIAPVGSQFPSKLWEPLLDEGVSTWSAIFSNSNEFGPVHCYIPLSVV